MNSERAPHCWWFQKKSLVGNELKKTMAKDHLINNKSRKIAAWLVSSERPPQADDFRKTTPGMMTQKDHLMVDEIGKTVPCQKDYFMADEFRQTTSWMMNLDWPPHGWWIQKDQLMDDEFRKTSSWLMNLDWPPHGWWIQKDQLMADEFRLTTSWMMNSERPAHGWWIQKDHPMADSCP